MTTERNLYTDKNFTVVEDRDVMSCDEEKAQRKFNTHISRRSNRQLTEAFMSFVKTGDWGKLFPNGPKVLRELFDKPLAQIMPDPEERAAQLESVVNLSDQDANNLALGGDELVDIINTIYNMAIHTTRDTSLDEMTAFCNQLKYLWYTHFNVRFAGHSGEKKRNRLRKRKQPPQEEEEKEDEESTGETDNAFFAACGEIGRIGMEEFIESGVYFDLVKEPILQILRHNGYQGASKENIEKGVTFFKEGLLGNVVLAEDFVLERTHAHCEFCGLKKWLTRYLITADLGYVRRFGSKCYPVLERIIDYAELLSTTAETYNKRQLTEHERIEIMTKLDEIVTGLRESHANKRHKPESDEEKVEVVRLDLLGDSGQPSSEEEDDEESEDVSTPVYQAPPMPSLLSQIKAELRDEQDQGVFSAVHAPIESQFDLNGFFELLKCALRDELKRKASSTLFISLTPDGVEIQSDARHYADPLVLIFTGIPGRDAPQKPFMHHLVTAQVFKHVSEIWDNLIIKDARFDGFKVIAHPPWVWQISW